MSIVLTDIPLGQTYKKLLDQVYRVTEDNIDVENNYRMPLSFNKKIYSKDYDIYIERYTYGVRVDYCDGVVSVRLHPGDSKRRIADAGNHNNHFILYGYRDARNSSYLYRYDDSAITPEIGMIIYKMCKFLSEYYGPEINKVYKKSYLTSCG